MKQLNTTKLTKGGKSMEKEYDIEKLNPRKNPYAKRVKKQITINIDGDTLISSRQNQKNVVFPIKH